MLWVEDTLTTDLPIAPPVKREDVPVLCQSDVMTYNGEVIKRSTIHLFIHGLLHQFVAEHNARSLSTSLEVDGKIEK